NKNKTSNIVNDQKNKNYNLLTRESLIDNDKNDLLCLLGKEKCISSIFVYPSSYESKDKIINSINKYNNDYISNKVSIIDESKIMYDMSIKIIDIITIVLICFSSISLIVSSIMIGIITYISVLERKKEIGILRSMGSSKKDIKFLFIMENVLLGFSSGIVGIFISIMSSPIINTIFKRLLETDSIFLMKFSNNIMLILLSISLSVLGAYIPSKKASDENIITSLESI
ncbi:MAG: FtsX-like permease family protein, partial [Bacilli bacterium]|nr:FtsX-like permease family protein [Bacilli bacterium]